MTEPTISAVALIGLIFALAAAARILLRAVLVAGLVIGELAVPRERTSVAPWCDADLPLAA